MTGLRATLALLLLAWALAARGASPIPVRIVADVQGGSAQQLVEILQARLPSADFAFQVEVVPPARWSVPPVRSLVVTLGPEAWRAVAAVPAADAPWLALAPPRRELEGLRRRGIPVYGLMTQQSPARWMALARLAFPDRTALGLLAGPETEEVLPELERAAANNGRDLTVERIDAAQDVGPATERISQQSTVLLAWPDTRVHNRYTVQPLLLVTYRAGVPVIGHSDAYLKAGAVLALYATPEQLAEQIAESLASLRAGRSLAAFQWPRQFTVGVNLSVARSLDIALPSASQLQRSLRESGS